MRVSENSNEKEEAGMVILAWVSIAVNAVLLYLLFTKHKKRSRSDMSQLVKALEDFEARKGCIIEVRRLEPDNLIIWGAK